MSVPSLVGQIITTQIASGIYDEECENVAYNNTDWLDIIIVCFVILAVCVLLGLIIYYW